VLALADRVMLEVLGLLLIQVVVVAAALELSVYP
jgi:hypothetical protein